MFRHILVPVDLTDKNSAALNITLDMAMQNSSRITLLHVIESIDFVSEKEEEGFYKKLEKNAQERIILYAKPLEAQGISVGKEIVLGKRTKEIVHYAVNHQVDLIILSSHKIDIQNPTEGWGTISYKVAILSQCPVLLVK